MVVGATTSNGGNRAHAQRARNESGGESPHVAADGCYRCIVYLRSKEKKTKLNMAFLIALFLKKIFF